MRLWGGAVAALVLLGGAGLALGYDPEGEFKRGTIVVTPSVGGGVQNNVEDHGSVSDIALVNATTRVSVLPLDPLGSGPWRGALEAGLEPWLQFYVSHEFATAEGLKLAFRYHFLGASPVFPYVEALAGIGATSLDAREVNSTQAFVLEAGVGLSYFVTEGIALTAGYRFHHISNGNTGDPNRGFNADTGVIGISFFYH